MAENIDSGGMDASGDVAPWASEIVERIAATDDLHIAPYRPDGRTTGTPTWIWSVVVDGRLFVRAWNGVNGRWYRSAIAQRAGRITAAGQEHDVAFIPVKSPELNERIDAAYEVKYAGSPYLPPMIAPGPKAATVEIAPLRPGGQVYGRLPRNGENA